MFLIIFSLILLISNFNIGYCESGDNYDPMTSNIAPQDTDQSNGYTLPEARLAQIRKILMYPFYDTGSRSKHNGDLIKKIKNSNPQVTKNLDFHLPFFGFRFNYTRVSLNGYLEFSDPPPYYEYPLVFPVKQWPKKNDPSLIGIFLSQCRIGNLRDKDIDRRTPGVYFRLEKNLRRRTDRIGVEIYERLKWDIREGIIGAEIFDPKHAIIVTWKNVSFIGGVDAALYKTNTFQMVLATDEVFTYAMFNYLNLDWTSHTEAGGDTLNGEGGVPAFIGFNAGNGTRSFEYMPFSQRSIIKDLTKSGFGNGLQGRHIFRIDEEIVGGSCNPYQDGSHMPLKVSPERGNMLGGTVVNITGPCFNPNDKIRCSFGAYDQVDGYVVDKNRVICIQPQLYAQGWISLRLRINSKNIKWSAGRYYVDSPANAPQNIFFEGKVTPFSVNPISESDIKLVWSKKNLSINDNVNVQISLWGYREASMKPDFFYITDIANDIKNTGEFTIVPSQLKEKLYILYTSFGFLKINLTDPIPINSNVTKGITPVIWSRPIPLLWYSKYQWESLYGKNWPKKMCDKWLKADSHLKDFVYSLPQCPCTLRQALADKGKFIPDLECDKDSNPDCYYNKNAVHCIKTPFPTSEGAEQQCCYNHNGNLILSQDEQYGSSPKRCHNLGSRPYNEATKVPTLSQWYHDIMPKYICCIWQDEQSEGCESLRNEKRQSQSCVDYESPGIAAVYGDPHILTFDDVEYTFNGKGEFVLVKSIAESDNFKVQGRFEQVGRNAYGDVRATKLTSIVANGNSPVRVEVRARVPDSKWRYGLDVFADGIRLYLDRQKFQQFPGVTVYTPTYILNQTEVIIMFDNGAGVEVIDHHGYLSTKVYLPRSLINKTVGLLGSWSFNKEDDFTLPYGTKAVIANINDMESIYREFGMKWMVDETLHFQKGISLFHRDFGRSSSTYNDKTFSPQFLMNPGDFIQANRSVLIVDAESICSLNVQECLYDYGMTMDKKLALSTKHFKTSLSDLKETIRTKVVTCSVLKTPKFGRKSTYLSMPGAQVMFECHEGFVLVGDKRRICRDDGEWDETEYGYTYCIRPEGSFLRVAGFSSGLVLMLPVSAILLIVFLVNKILRKKKNRRISGEMHQQQKSKFQEGTVKKLSSLEEDGCCEDLI